MTLWTLQDHLSEYNTEDGYWDTWMASYPDLTRAQLEEFLRKHHVPERLIRERNSAYYNSSRYASRFYQWTEQGDG